MDREHRNYVKNIRNWHNQHGLNAGMMTESDGAAMKAAKGCPVTACHG
jgi:hypothetical protein